MARIYKFINVSGSGTDDKKVKATTNDTTPDYLDGKLSAGSSKLVKTLLNSGADETIQFDVDDSQIDHDSLLNYVLNEHRPMIDEDDMVSDSNTSVPSQQSVKAFVEGKTTTYESLFNATTDWGAPSGNLYTITILESTHGKGIKPLIQVFELIGADYEEVTPNSILIDATGDISITVTQSLDNRFEGKILIL